MALADRSGMLTPLRFRAYQLSRSLTGGEFVTSFRGVVEFEKNTGLAAMALRWETIGVIYALFVAVATEVLSIGRPVRHC
ncbi:hypothetical protein [Haloarcula amylolytica]|uniref:hypothetical protein n=1 Tax=Haloarcula amylolytica TaxID=396317 RepID=UPI00126782AD|nr:hypothetical protein [Haloarcula amylolytica]